jgi:hypothetical protein
VFGRHGDRVDGHLFGGVCCAEWNSRGQLNSNWGEQSWRVWKLKLLRS